MPKINADKESNANKRTLARDKVESDLVITHNGERFSFREAVMEAGLCASELLYFREKDRGSINDNIKAMSYMVVDYGETAEAQLLSGNDLVKTSVEEINKLYDRLEINVLQAFSCTQKVHSGYQDKFKGGDHSYKNLVDKAYALLAALNKNFKLIEVLRSHSKSSANAESQHLDYEMNKTSKLQKQIHSMLDLVIIDGQERENAYVSIDAIIRVAVARSNRVMWADKKNHQKLADLSAPQFLKLVHAEDIKDGIVDKVYIRAIDKGLMDAVEAYVSRRMDRAGKLDLGFAEGLTFQASRPGRNVKDRTISLVP